MKYLSILSIALLLCINLVAQDLKEIKLNAPNKNRGVSIMQAFVKIQSSKEFSDEKLSLQDMSDLLWAACGINRPESGKRTAPSSQNTQDIDVYVCLEEGTYIYNATTHSLQPVIKTDLRALTNESPTSQSAPCILLIVADSSRYSAKNTTEHILNMCKVDAGIVSQNISLCCAGIGIGTRPRARMKHEELRKGLSLKDSQLLILNHPVGYIK